MGKERPVDAWLVRSTGGKHRLSSVLRAVVPRQ